MHFDFIDDEATIRNLIRVIIAQEGYGIKTFTSAEDYMTYFSSPDFESPIAIISDIRMPGMNGISLVRYIHEQAPSQKLVLVSATPEEAADVDGQLCALITKPFKAAGIINLLKALKHCMDCGQCEEDVPSGQCRYGIEHSCPNSDRLEES